MRAWLLSIGEPLPCDGKGDRLWRTGHLAKALVHAGHEVRWWTSTFHHKEKKQRANEDHTWSFLPGCELQLLHANSYSRNISFARYRNHRTLAKRFLQQASELAPPDIIVSSLPTLDFCAAATKYGKENDVPVVIDVRDLWPDIFVDCSPQLMRSSARLLLSPLFRQAQQACAAATGLTGITDAFVDWAVDKVRRERNQFDQSFPMGYSETTPSSDEIQAAEHFWAEQGVTANSNEFTICFFGTLGRHFEIPTVLEAARKLEQMGRNVRWVICGTGSHSDAWKSQAKDLQSVTFPGWVSAAQIWTLMRLSQAALAPYVSTHDFARSLPNKSIEYLSAGLPIVSSLQGVLADLLQKSDCGWTYQNGSPDQLIQIVNRLVENRDQLDAMSHKALTLYQDRFTAENVYAKMADHLQAIATAHESRKNIFSLFPLPYGERVG